MGQGSSMSVLTREVLIRALEKTYGKKGMGQALPLFRKKIHIWLIIPSAWISRRKRLLPDLPCFKKCSPYLYGICIFVLFHLIRPLSRHTVFDHVWDLCNRIYLTHKINNSYFCLPWPTGCCRMEKMLWAGPIHMLLQVSQLVRSQYLKTLGRP